MTMKIEEKNHGTLMSDGQKAFNKVPEITLYFWFVKIMCTTVGETAADYLNVNLNLGLTGTSLVTGALLLAALFFQFRAKTYNPSKYWISVMLISVFGTLVTDNLTDKMGVPLEASTIIFSVLLGGTFFVWYFYEKTLSIHAIFTKRRESFYWLAILVTFALGTAAGDLMAEGLGLGYAVTGLIIAGLIALFAVGWKFKLNPVLSFWVIYILTRPLGALLGDYLSQPRKYGGLGLGASVTSFIFVGGIVAIIVFLSVTKKDAIGKNQNEEVSEDQKGSGVWQTAIVVSLLVVAGTIGYRVRHSALQTPVKNEQVGGHDNSTTQGMTASPSSELLPFRSIAQNTLELLEAGNQTAATKRIGDLEYEWDNAEARLKPKDPAKWAAVDKKIDTVLRELRAVHPTSVTEKSALKELLLTL
jgi:uncharacterized membrane-anchored protein